ncbi:MAG: MBL fold metallo-hydrolase [Rhabdaerophilum sp.]
MRAVAYGGFGEKGRTAIALESGGEKLLLDCGVNTSDRANFYPAIEPEDWQSIRALIITHAHEDHIAAFGWCIAQGFRGQVLMTSETREEADAIWHSYAKSEELSLAKRYPVQLIPARGSFNCGPFEVTTGRSGHIVGGVWVHVQHAGRSALYCGDVVPRSPVFPMDPLPPCDLLMIDASYGLDDEPAMDRQRSILEFLALHPGTVLPSPLIGRSLEILALVPQPLALAPGMRAALNRQMQDLSWISADIHPLLTQRFAAARDWEPDESWPEAPILCHDGMGLSGPSKEILARAEREGRSILFTGHVPDGSPGARLLEANRAQWRRFPTHPTLSENIALVSACRPRMVLAHSCSAEILPHLAESIPGLSTTIRPRGFVNV